ncbi:hypothetical protein FRC11_012462, partial [Ceratobasidium sp. 423]
SETVARFTPKLSVYVTRNYKVNEVLRGEVETDAIWTQNLNEIDDVTSWNFVEHPSTGEFSVEPTGN